MFHLIVIDQTVKIAFAATLKLPLLSLGLTLSGTLRAVDFTDRIAPPDRSIACTAVFFVLQLICRLPRLFEFGL